MKKLFHIVILFLGLFGVFFGTLPDLFPNIAPKFLFGDVKEMKTGYQQIIKFTEMKSKERETSIALKKETPGYEAILRILHKFNPVIVPPPAEKINKSFGNISTDRFSLVKYVDPGMNLTLNKKVYFQTDEKTWEEVCEIRDLYYTIEVAAGRYYAKIGFFFAIIAILIEGFSSIAKTPFFNKSKKK